MKNPTTRRIAESAMLIAIATVLGMIELKMPFGGGVTICSMLPLVVISHRYGWKWGVFTAFAYSLIQLMLGLNNVGYATSFLMAVAIILLDYVLAFTVIGLSGVFDLFIKNRRAALAVGIAVTFTLRFLSHLLSGALIWDVWMPEEFMGMTMTNPWQYSFLYNGSYMLVELIVTEIVAMAIYAPLGRYFRGEDIIKK